MYYCDEEEQLLRELDRKLEMEQTLKLFQHLPMGDKELYVVLERRTNNLMKLVVDGIISSNEYNLLFPASRKTDFTKMGPSLLHVLIYTFCCESPEPVAVWYQDPPSDDQSQSSCYVRIMLARTMIQNALGACGLLYKDYQRIFNYVRQSLLQLGNEPDELAQFTTSEQYGVASPIWNFEGRENDLLQMHNKLTETKSTKQMGLVLKGEMGVGKTEAVRKYCQQYGRFYDWNVIWFDAKSKYTFASDCRKLTIQLGLPVKNELGNFLSTQSIVSRISWYFENTKLLYVFDNVHSSYQIMKFLPTAENHYSIIVSVSDFPRNKFIHYSLRSMSTDEASAFLRKGIHITNCSRQARWRKQLVKLLNGHPYAMAIAMAYMKETNTKIEQYLKILKRVMNGENRTERNSSLFFALLVTFNHMNSSEENAVASYVFNVLSFLDGQNISLSVLRQITSMKFKHYHEVTIVLKKLKRLLLIQSQIDRKSKERITVSPSIQEEIKAHENNGLTGKREAFQYILKCMIQSFCAPSQHHDASVQDWFLHLLHISKTKDFYRHFIHVCIENQSVLLYTFSSYGQTEDLLEILWEIENQFLDDKQARWSFMTKINIARAYQSLGDIDEALTEYRNILEDVVKTYGDADSVALECQLCIASCFYKQKNYNAVAEICQKLSGCNNITTIPGQSLQLKIDVLLLKSNMKQRQVVDVIGKLHEFESTLPVDESLIRLKVKVCIAKYLYLDGQFDESIKIYEDAESKQGEILGDSHRDVLKTQKLLAQSYFETDQFEKTLQKNKEIVLCQTFTLGEYHRDTLRTKYRIAKCLEKTGKIETAHNIFIMVESLQKLFVVNGKFDDLVSTKDSAASCLYTMGHYEEALVKYQEKEQMQVEMFGQFDSEVLKTRHAIAVCLHSTGKLQDAMCLYQQIKSTQEKLLGRSSIETLRTEHNLSLSLLDGGQENLALIRLVQLEKSQINSLGHHHPDVTTTQHNIAVCLHKKKLFDFAIQKYNALENSLEYTTLGDTDMKLVNIKHDTAVCLHEKNQLSNAIAKYEDALTLQTQMLGELHPDVLATRYNIAVCYHDNKNIKGAVVQLEDIEKLQTHVLGDDHPDVRRTRASLSVCKKENQLWGDDLYCTIL